jgi:hypothetical protein
MENKRVKATYCVRCEEKLRKEGDICRRWWEGQDDAPMCGECWDITEREEDEEEE